MFLLTAPAWRMGQMQRTNFPMGAIKSTSVHVNTVKPYAPLINICPLHSPYPSPNSAHSSHQKQEITQAKSPFNEWPANRA